MAGRIPSRGSDQFNLRLPDGMRDALKAAADNAGRSMNAEIIARLEASFSSDSGSLNEDLIKRVADEAAKRAVRRHLQATQDGFIEITAEEAEEIRRLLKLEAVNQHRNRRRVYRIVKTK